MTVTLLPGMSSRIRIGNLSKAFGYGTSPMYDLIAEICVLYEDLKLETEKLFHAAEDLQREGEVKKPFEVLYYIRRSTVSLNEYRRALNTLNAEKGFRRTLASLDVKDVRAVAGANRYFQANHKQIKDLRDAFGGHIVPAYARHATANFAPNEVGKIEWSFDSAHSGD